MLEFTTKPDPTEPQIEREELFSIDGKSYTIPKRFEPLEMAKYTHLVDTLGADSAGMWALQAALGDEGYFAYLNLPPRAVSQEDFVVVMQVVTGRMVGLSTVIPKGPDPAPDAGPETESLGEPASEPPDSEVWPDDEPVETAS